MCDINSPKPLNLPYHVRNLYERYLLTLEVVGCKQLDVNTWYVLSITHNWEHGTFKITLMKKQTLPIFHWNRGFFKNMREFYGVLHKRVENGRCWPENIRGLIQSGRLLYVSATFVIIEYRTLAFKQGWKNTKTYRANTGEHEHEHDFFRNCRTRTNTNMSSSRNIEHEHPCIFIPGQDAPSV